MDDIIYALAAADNRLYAARASGLFASEDAGQHWRDLYESLRLDVPLLTTAVAVNGAVIIAGVSGGIMHSIDAGEHWQFRRFPTPEPVISSLLLADVVLAGTLEDGLFYSPDRGTTWLPQNYGLLDPCVLALTIMPSGDVFAGTSSGLFRSNNGGRSWQQTNFPPAPVLSMTATADCELLVGTENAGMWRSTDITNRWCAVGEASGDAPVNQILMGDDGVFAASENRLLFSQDDGRSWSIQQVFDKHIGALALAEAAPTGISIWIALGNEVRVYSR